jgi:hypothetical protein
LVLRVIREPSRRGATLGSLYVNNVWECWTLEDEIREQKVPRKTCIPAGGYRVVLSMSNRFKRVLPEVLNVPNFSGVRIHPGNTIDDTEGCLLVGQGRGDAAVAFARAAMESLFPKIDAALRNHETVSLVVENPPALSAAP